MAGRLRLKWIRAAAEIAAAGINRVVSNAPLGEASSQARLPNGLRSVIRCLAPTALLAPLLLSGCLSHSLTSIQVNPSTVALNLGQTAQLSVQGSLTENNHASTSENLTSLVNWTSSTPSVATVSSGGLVTGMTDGTTTITASVQGTFGLLYATSTVTVTGTSSSGSTSTLTSIAITPGTQTIANPGQTTQFIAIGSYSGGTSPTADLTSQVTWTSSNASVATIHAGGLATATGVGTTTITASMQSSNGPVIASATITVTNPARALASIALTPGTQTIANAGQTVQFSAVGTYTSGTPSSSDLTQEVTWTSADSSVATINAQGLATGVAPGTTTITASFSGTAGLVTATAAMTVSSSARALTTLAITPQSQTVAIPGQTAQYVAVGAFSSGTPSSSNLTSQVTWTSSQSSVATINAQGLATAVGAGTTTITGSFTGSAGLVTDTATLTVTNSPRNLASLAIIPQQQTVSTLDETAQYIAIGTYTSGSPVTADLTTQVQWSSSDTNVAVITPTGLATTLGVGTSAITASATASDGSLITNTAVFTNNGDGGAGSPSLATVTLYLVGNSGGAVTGVANGTQVLACTSPGGTAQSCVASLPIGQSLTLTATPLPGSQFDGWSSACRPHPSTSSTCTITIGNNTSIGAIFDVTAP